MNKTQFRKLTSRVLRHSGFQVRMNKATKEYELCDSSPAPFLFCKPIIMTEAEVTENYLCFRVLNKMTANQEKLYQRMINRFTRLAPSINISLEDESEPIFTDEQFEKLDELLTEHEPKQGEPHEDEQNNE